MIKNYFKIAWRNLLRNKAFSFINIFGLAVGLASCLLIMLYIFDESSYDKHQKNGDRIFRIAAINNKGETWAATSGPLAFTLKNNLPEVDEATRLMTFPDIARMLLKYESGSEKKQFFESNGYYVDSTFFQLFTYNFIYGNAATALNEPNSLVISEEISHKFFGNKNPVGKPLLINTPFGEFNYTIKAVFDGSEYKSHIPASYFLSMRNNDMWNWVKQQTALVGNGVFFTYLKLKKGVDAKLAERKVQSYFDDKAGADMKAMGFKNTLFFQPVKDIYLHSSVGNEIGSNGNITYLYILGTIAAFIIIIACINFMNLSTARSEKRAKEVGVRKVMGAEKKSLVWQFLGESFMMCIMSLVIASLLVQILLPYFNNLTQKNISFFDNDNLIFWIVGLTLLTGLFAGLYPAFYLSAFKPIAVLKGKIINSFSATALRKGLVIFQFTISICLVFAAIVIWRQLTFIKDQQLGFNKNQKLVLPLQASYRNSENNYTALKNELLKYPEVKSVTSGSAYPGVVNLNDMLFFGEGRSTKDNVDVHITAVENDYIETLGFQLLSGRAFSKDFTADSAGIILNEVAVKQLGYDVTNAVGKKIQFDIGNFKGAMQIVGVVKNFNFESLHNQIQPHGFTTTMFSNRYGYFIASLNTNNYAAVLKKIERTWAKLNPAVPFEYSFLDQDFQRNYQKDQLTSDIVLWFTIIAILIACLGLFGLSAFSAEQRTKEIGIRKVLGATVSQVTMLLSKDFIKLVSTAVLIASPLAWWAMNKWLQAFAYKINISWWIFVLAGCIAVFIALVTVSFQAIKAAIANPVKSLRTE
ncbi:MAG: ABC transporter permease [Ginsengibacter sp.]